MLYGASAAIGPARLHDFLVRRGRWFRLTPRDIERAEEWFDRHAVLAVLLGRCVPLVRSLISVPAGFRRMHPVPFTVYTILGSLIWNTGLISAGYLLRHNWDAVEPWISYAQYAVIAAIAVGVGMLFRRRLGSDAG